jgi:glycosyltransferase involved in cell wall biosynthesis
MGGRREPGADSVPMNGRCFLIAWHPGQRQWAGGLRYTALLQNVVRKLGFERVEERRDVPKSPRFWIFYVLVTWLHLWTVLFSKLGLTPLWRPLGRCCKRVLSWLLLPSVASDPSRTVLFEIGKSLFSRAAVNLLWVPDLQHRRLPRYFSVAQWLNREINWRGSYCLADGVVASSRAVGDDLVQLWGRRAPIYSWKFPSSAPFAAAGAPPVAPPYLLYAAQFWPHKGHEELCRAFRDMIAGRTEPATLVLAGRPEAALPALQDWLRSEKLEGRIHLALDAPDDVMGALMKNAAGLVFPSHFEGWSTGVLEAISLKTPLVLSDIPAHVEVGLPVEAYFKVGDAGSIRASLERLLFDSAFREKIVASYDRLQIPSVESFARDVQAALEAVGAGK